MLARAIASLGTNRYASNGDRIGDITIVGMVPKAVVHHRGVALSQVLAPS